MNIPSHGKYQWLSILYAFVSEYKPTKVVELGPATGYTTITMAQALKDNNNGHINSYDIWNDQYWVTQENCQNEINNWNVQDYVTLKHMDFYDWIETNEEFDFLYMDIDNDGDKISKLYESVKPQIETGSIVLFEGGSEERDKYVDENVTKMNDVKDKLDYNLLTNDTKYSVSGIWNKEMYQ